MTEFQGQKSCEEFNTLWKIFTTAARDPACGNVVFVIDGLDEYEESTRTLLIDSLVMIYSEHEKPGKMDTFLKFIVN